MKQLILILLIAGICTTTLSAQNPNAKAINLQQVSDVETYFMMKEYSIRAVGSLEHTTANDIDISQKGTANIIVLQQVGRGNRSVINQKGEDHTYSGSLTGNNNVNLILQEGANNILIQEIKANNQISKITQQGYNNELRQYENGIRPSVPMEVTQKGVGMQLIISNGNIFH